MIHIIFLVLLIVALLFVFLTMPRATFKADMELVRIAFPRKVFTLSQAIYALDRLQWLYDNRELLGPMAYDDIPGMTRCFRTPLKPLTDWPERLIAKFKEDLGDR